MQLSIIIVNYNVKHFLEQCLLSVQKAIEGIAAEIIVIDNNSVDGSQQMLKEKFGNQITFIENHDNPGFSKANNQGIRIAKGKYVLLLNPDTVVEEGTFRETLDFMEAHPKAGGLGVKMLDGEGKFLPESKRGLPTPWVSFYKIFGLAKLFPKNKTFGQYHLTYLDKDETHEIEILSGAFMLMRKEVLDKVGYLDEDFFMYGEDIDLSYRILLGGYKNYYFAGTKIIHYKGESTKKGSLNYVRVFYNAMIIFAQKHFGGSRKRLFIFTIRIAVYFRALLAVVHRLWTRFSFPAFEALLVYGMIYGVKEYWEHYVKYIEGGEYPLAFDLIAAPVYTLVFISFLGLAGAYKKPYQIRPIVTATFAGFIGIATFSFIFSSVNFSRAIVGLASVFTMVITMTTRGIINLREKRNFFFTEPNQKRVLIAGDYEGIGRINRLLNQELDYRVEVIGAVVQEVEEGKPLTVDVLGSLAQLKEILHYYRVEEVIFCNKSIATQDILDLMWEAEKRVAYKLVPPGVDYIVGPQSIHTSRYQQRIRPNLQKREMRLRKRALDMVVSSAMLLSYPLLFWRYKRPLRALKHIGQVIFGRKHLVGYIQQGREGLPQLKAGLLSMLNRGGEGTKGDSVNREMLDRYYARMYSWDLDLEIVMRAWRDI